MPQVKWVFSKAFLDPKKAAAHMGDLGIRGYYVKHTMSGKKIYIYHTAQSRGELQGMFGKKKTARRGRSR